MSLNIHKLPARFREPLTEETMTELLGYQELLQLEVERVSRVCAYWKANVMDKRPRILKQVRTA